MDWSVTCEHSNDATRRQARARTDGLAAAHAVDKKKARYPQHGREQVPAVFEGNGRPADVLISLVRAHGRDLPDTGRSAIVADTWRQIQRRLATGNAEMVLNAGEGATPPLTMTQR